MMLLQKMLLIALAGGLGALARYGLSGLVLRATGAGLPYGTLAVNVLGCFLFGLVWALAAERMMISPEMRTIVLVGFLGSFTTLSTFIFESHSLLADARWLVALGNLVVMNIASLALFALGLAIGRVV
jgi:CrcB protein